MSLDSDCSLLIMANYVSSTMGILNQSGILIEDGVSEALFMGNFFWLLPDHLFFVSNQIFQGQSLNT